MNELAIVVDCETTGFSPDDDRIIELCITDFHSEEILFHSYFDPQRQLPEKIVEITKITDDMLVGAPLFSQHYELIAQYLFNPEVKAMIGYNVVFDRGMLSGEFRRVKRQHPNLPLVDAHFPTLVCAKRLWDNCDPVQPRNLMNAYKRFVDPNGFDGAHGARQDTTAVLRVVKSQILEYGLGDKTWIEIDPEQKKWWGPSNHVVIENGTLIWNVKGKYHRVACHSIERGYWQWVTKKDFPDHIMEMATFIIYALKEGEGAVAQLYSWAYGRRL